MTPGQDESIADIYVGEYVNGKAHGTGKFTWAGQIFFCYEPDSFKDGLSCIPNAC